MSDGRAGLSRVLGPSLTPFLKDLSVFRGLDHSTWFGHGTGQFLGNFSGVSNNQQLAKLENIRTIDYLLSTNSKFDPSKRPSVCLGWGRCYSYGPDATGAVIQRSQLANTVLRAYNILFNNGALPEGGDTTPPSAHPRRDVLSRVLEDFNRVRNGRQISRVDRLVLDNAFDKISDLQRGLAAEANIAPLVCKHKGLDTTQDGTMFDSSLTMKNFANLIIAIALCDLSRVVNFSMGISGAYDKTPDPNIDFHQGHSHSPFDVVLGQVNWEYMGDIHAQSMRYFMAPLLKGLSEAIDPANGKSILYNSLVHYGIEHSQVHSQFSAPTLLAGSAAGAIKSGNYIDFSNYSHGPVLEGPAGMSRVPTDPNFHHDYYGIPYNQLLVTIMQAFGLGPSDYENSGINSHWQNRSDGLYGPINNGISNVGGYGYITMSAEDMAANPYISKQYRAFGRYNFHHWKNPIPMPG